MPNDYYRRDKDGNVEGIAKLVFMREDDFHKVMKAVNIANLMMHEITADPDKFPLHNLDGEPLDFLDFEAIQERCIEASHALGTARYIGAQAVMPAILFAH
jgi:hypothetical protein